MLAKAGEGEEEHRQLQSAMRFTQTQLADTCIKLTVLLQFRSYVIPFVFEASLTEA